jgi:hypothetical protein
LDGLENLSPVDRHFWWMIDAQSDSIAADVNDSNRNIVTDGETFADLTLHDDHGSSPPFG